MDDRPRGRVVLLAVEREGRPAGDDDVHLLVAEPLLGVLLDDVLARACDVRVRPERLDAQRPAKRLPVDACGEDRLELVETKRLPAVRRHATSVARPGTRSAPAV